MMCQGGTHLRPQSWESPLWML